MPEQPESCAQLDTDASHGSPCTSEDNRTASAAPSAQREAKRLWTPAEDEQLVLVVHKYGASRWSLIATHVPGRAGKQCRERWFNHLCPEVKKGEWSAEEDETLLRAVAELGSQWSIIVKRMHGRTDNAIKNRYNTIQRRARSTHAHSPAPSHRLASVPCWASPDGASPGSGSDSADTAGTPKRARDDADDPVGADADAAGFGVDESFSEVFGALLEGMPPTPAIAASRPAPAVGPSAPLLLHAAQCRRERLTALAAELASCDATDPDQHGAIDALIEQLAAAAGPPEACVRGKVRDDVRGGRGHARERAYARAHRRLTHASRVRRRRALALAPRAGAQGSLPGQRQRRRVQALGLYGPGQRRRGGRKIQSGDRRRRRF